MKRNIGLVLLVLLGVLLSLGCVSKGTYSQVVLERDGLNQQLQTRTTERDSAQQSLTTALAELANVKTERDNAQRDLAAARGELASAKAERDGAKSDLNNANQRVATAQGDLGRSQSDLATAKQTYEVLKVRAAKAQKYLDVIEAYTRLSLAHVTANHQEWLQAYGQTTSAVAASEDQFLKDAWGSVTKLAANGGTEVEVNKLDLEFLKLLTKRLGEIRDLGVPR